MRQCEAPEANVLLVLRQRREGVVIGSVWGLWTAEELRSTFTELQFSSLMIGHHYVSVGPDVQIEILIVGDIQ